MIEKNMYEKPFSCEQKISSENSVARDGNGELKTYYLRKLSGVEDSPCSSVFEEDMSYVVTTDPNMAQTINNGLVVVHADIHTPLDITARGKISAKSLERLLNLWNISGRATSVLANRIAKQEAEFVSSHTVAEAVQKIDAGEISKSEYCHGFKALIRGCVRPGVIHTLMTKRIFQKRIGLYTDVENLSFLFSILKEANTDVAIKDFLLAFKFSVMALTGFDALVKRDENNAIMEAIVFKKCNTSIQGFCLNNPKYSGGIFDNHIVRDMCENGKFVPFFAGFFATDENQVVDGFGLPCFRVLPRMTPFYKKYASGMGEPVYISLQHPLESIRFHGGQDPNSYLFWNKWKIRLLICVNDKKHLMDGRVNAMVKKAARLSKKGTDAAALSFLYKEMKSLYGDMFDAKQFMDSIQVIANYDGILWRDDSGRVIRAAVFGPDEYKSVYCFETTNDSDNS